MAMAQAADSGRRVPVNRPRELQDPLNFYFYHPLARRLARLLVPTPVSPNMVSVLSLVCLSPPPPASSAWPGRKMRSPACSSCCSGTSSTAPTAISRG